MSLSLAMLLAYVAIQLGVGVVVSRRIRTEDDYLVAGRSLGPLMATASVFATWFGAETCIGAAGQVYANGASAVSADPFGYGLCLLLMGVLLAGPLWRRGVVTLADLFRQRYSPVVERAVALLVIPGSILWAAAQIRAFGTVVAATGGVSPEQGMLVAIVVVLVYTTFGGMLADAYTDLLQGAVLVVGLGVLAVVALPDAPALAQAFTAPAPAGPSSAGALPGALVTLNDWAIPVLGSLFAQELLMRISSARSARVARRSTVGAGAIYLVVGVIPVLLGLLGRSVVPGIDQADAVLPAVTRHYLGELGFIVLSGALVSAILSTVDSALLACGSLVAHNLVPPRVRDASPTAALRVARVSVVGLGLVAFGLAHGSDSVHGLVHEASAFGSTGVFVIGVMALTSRVGGPAAALAALGCGLGSWIVLAHVIGSPIAYLGSLACAAAAYAIVALLSRPPRFAEFEPEVIDPDAAEHSSR
jgi:solute:Na+ symporter, SSS family